MKPILQIHNTLSGEKEIFEPINNNTVGMYTCGPTVYSYVTVGNWRTYTLGDIVYRTLHYFGYEVTYIMNITDVGHLTGDNEGDASQGEDRMEKAKRREGKTAWEVAEFYTNDFLEGFQKLNLLPPQQFTRATDHIKEQVAMVKELQRNNLTYLIEDDGIYFDVGAYEAAGNIYGELSTLDHSKDGQSRIEPNPKKKDPRDFALWKFSPKDVRRDMQWESPWGLGFPGWHIECSAMSCKYLGDQFDIHIGGEDLRQTHHPNEIAQTEGATGKKPFVKYWLHGAFLLIDGGRMGKSLGNAYTLHDIEERGFNLLALRYFYFTGKYTTRINFTWDNLESSQNSLDNVYNQLRHFRRLAEGPQGQPPSIARPSEQNQGYVNIPFKEKFMGALADDLNMPEALAVLHELLGSGINPADIIATALDFDQVLGLDMDNATKNEVFITPELQELLDLRKVARSEKNWHRADQIRDDLLLMGFEVIDTDTGQYLSKIPLNEEK